MPSLARGIETACQNGGHEKAREHSNTSVEAYAALLPTPDRLQVLEGVLVIVVVLGGLLLEGVENFPFRTRWRGVRRHCARWWWCCCSPETSSSCCRKFVFFILVA